MFKKPAANRDRLDLLRYSECFRSCTDADRLRFWQPTTQMVKGCLKRDLIAKIWRAEVSKKTYFFVHTFAQLRLQLWYPVDNRWRLPFSMPVVGCGRVHVSAGSFEFISAMTKHRLLERFWSLLGARTAGQTLSFAYAQKETRTSADEASARSSFLG